MSLRRATINLAQKNPELRQHLLPLLRKTAKRTKKAGGFKLPTFSKPELVVTARRILNAMKKEGGFNLPYYDFSKIQFDTVDKAAMLPPPYKHGYEAIWRVFPHGEFGDRKSEYAWGTVFVGMAVTGKGIQVASYIYVKT